MKPVRPWCALLAAAWLLAAASAPALATTVAEGVFDAGLMRNVQQPQTMHYRYEMQGRSLAEPYHSDVRMEVREVAADGAKRVWFDMFEGDNHRAFGPMKSLDQNPLVIVFLQRDVTQMGNLTGGSPNYFQQQVRRSFGEPATAEPLEVEVDGKKLPATRYVIHPYERDPNLERFAQFKDKAYEFVVAEGLPGGLYRIAASTPDPKDGHLILEESMTFVETRP